MEMKRLLSKLMLLVMVFTMFTSASNIYAARSDADALSETRAVAGCPDSSDGKHHMKSRGSCRAINVNTGEILDGMGGQCRYCNMLIVTQYNLFLYPSQGMGKYTTRDAWGYVGDGFTIEVNSISYNSSHTNAVGKSFVWK